MKLKEIAERINAHLKRFERDPVINREVEVSKGTKLTPFYWASAVDSGRYVVVRYVAYQGDTGLSKADAVRYLEWLDAGNVGRHHEAVGPPKGSRYTPTRSRRPPSSAK